jgi:hypothetical protein
MTIPVIVTAQTDVNSPINEALMEGLRQRSTLTPIGGIIPWFDYAGLIATPEGFMVCNGQIINSTNYDAESGRSAGNWTSQIGTCVLDGKYTPDMTGDTYLCGTSSALSNGNSAFAKVGNSTSNQINIEHNHKWYNYTAGNDIVDDIYNSSGSATDVTKITRQTSPSGTRAAGGIGVHRIDTYNSAQTTDDILATDAYTTKTLSTTQSIQPTSNRCKFLIRII